MGKRFVTLVLAFMAGPAWAQVNTSSIAGAVTDPSGSVVPDASITVTQAATGLERQTKAGAGGEYVLP